MAARGKFRTRRQGCPVGTTLAPRSQPDQPSTVTCYYLGEATATYLAYGKFKTTSDNLKKTFKNPTPSGQRVRSHDNHEV